MKKYLLIIVSFLMLNCNSSDDNNEVSTIDYTLISKNNLYGNGEEGLVSKTFVINSQEGFNELTEQMNSVNNVSNNFTETDIDFSQFKVIAVFDEIKESGGYEVDLKITSNSNNIIVDVINVIPEGDVTTVITQPYCIVKIPKSNLPVVFE